MNMSIRLFCVYAAFLLLFCSTTLAAPAPIVFNVLGAIARPLIDLQKLKLGLVGSTVDFNQDVLSAKRRFWTWNEPANYEPNDWQYRPYPGQLDNYPRPAAYPPPRPANYRNPGVGYGRQPAAGRPRGRNQRRRSNLSPPRTVYVRGALQFE